MALSISFMNDSGVFLIHKTNGIRIKLHTNNFNSTRLFNFYRPKPS